MLAAIEYWRNVPAIFCKTLELFQGLASTASDCWMRHLPLGSQPENQIGKNQIKNRMEAAVSVSRVNRHDARPRRKGKDASIVAVGRLSGNSGFLKLVLPTWHSYIDYRLRRIGITGF